MKINFAHIHEQGIDFIVFDADATTHLDRDRDQLLARLVRQAQANGLKVDKAALAFQEFGQLKFYGTSDLVGFLSDHGLCPWTHHLDL